MKSRERFFSTLWMESYFLIEKSIKRQTLCFNQHPEYEFFLKAFSGSNICHKQNLPTRRGHPNLGVLEGIWSNTPQKIVRHHLRIFFSTIWGAILSEMLPPEKMGYVSGWLKNCHCANPRWKKLRQRFVNPPERWQCWEAHPIFTQTILHFLKWAALQL